MAQTSTVSIYYKDIRPGAAVVYGRIKGRIGSANLRAKDFALSTIRVVMLTANDYDAKTIGTPIIGSIVGAGTPAKAKSLAFGSLGNHFILGSPGYAAGTLARTVNYIVMGE